MELIFIKDYKKPNGIVIKKGTKGHFTKSKALRLIDSKVARPLNIIDKAKEKFTKIKENAMHTPEDAEQAEQTTKPMPGEKNKQGKKK